MQIIIQLENYWFQLKVKIDIAIDTDLQTTRSYIENSFIYIYENS